MNLNRILRTDAPIFSIVTPHVNTTNNRRLRRIREHQIKRSSEPGVRRAVCGVERPSIASEYVLRELLLQVFYVTPHVTKNGKGHLSILDRRTTRQPGFAVSLSRDG
jgi:hypothetical protein